MGLRRRNSLAMKHIQTPYEQYLCDDNDKQYPETDESAKTLRELDCPDCIEAVWEILVEAMV